MALAETNEPASPSNEAVPAAEREDAGDNGATEEVSEEERASGSTETAVRGCNPACRSGFSCVDGSCVSACNPECATGETCTSTGTCVSREELRHANTVRRHDGFYLRLELGIGYFTGARSEQLFVNLPMLDGEVTGFAQVGALMLGGTVADGLVLGGGAFGANVPSARYSGDVLANGGSEPVFVANDVAVNLASVSLIGPFVAWYPDPTRGFHAEVATGFALASIYGSSGAAAFEVSEYEADGWGVLLGTGFDFWIGEQWSLGALARVSYAKVGHNSYTDTLSAWVPALALAATYH